MKQNQVIVNEKTLGNPPYWLCDISEDFEYINNEKTNNQIGWKYTIALPEKGLEKLVVKIAGKRQIPEIEDICKCTFNGLEIGVYVQNNQIKLKATAKEIVLVKEK